MRDSSLDLPARLAALLDADEWRDLRFEPVPVKPRHDGWTAQRQRGFIARLALCGCVAASARAVGKSAQSVRALRERPDAAGSPAPSPWRSTGAAAAPPISPSNGLSLGRSARSIIARGRRCGEHIHYDNRLLLAALNGVPKCQSSDAENIEILRAFINSFDKFEPSADAPVGPLP